MLSVRERFTRLFVGLLTAAMIALPVGYAYAEDCGCSGEGCQGCTIEFLGCDDCSASCENCDIQGVNCDDVRWECN